MALAVDQLSLGQIGTNCYLVRADRAATTAVVVDPGADAAEIRLASRDRARTCAGILLTHSHYDHIGALADLAEGTGAPVWLPQGELDVFRRPNDFFPGISVRAYEGEATLLAGRRDGRGGGHLVRGAPRARALSGPRLVLRRRLPLLRRRALRRLGRPHRPALRRLGDAARVDPLPGRRVSARDGRLLRATARRRRSATSSPAIRSSPSFARDEDRAAARHARHPPVRAAALAARDRRDGAALRALRLPARSRRPSSRTPSSSRARRARARTSSRRRCTRSPTAPTGR